MSAVVGRRGQLNALRKKLERLLASADVRTAPAISRELRAVYSELEALPDTGKGATIDQLKERRAKRQADTANRARSAGGG